MAASSFPTALSALGLLARFSPPAPIRAFLRTTGYRLRPPQPLPHVRAVDRAAREVLTRGGACPRQGADVLRELRSGDRPTIVLGGFVPDSTEQVYLLRGMLLRQGSVYYVNYPRRGFSLDLLCAQIDDLVAELVSLGQRPVILSVSFGAGLLVEWLRRSGRGAGIAGALLISPVACYEDIVDPSEPRPTTLLGRALRPFAAAGPGADPAAVEKARAIFSRMFESGSQNRAALAGLMAPDELRGLRSRVLAALNGIDSAGACERVAALRDLPHPRSWGAPGLAAPCKAPALALYAEKEGAVIAATSPTRLALEAGGRALFSRLDCRVVSGGESPVQHASLIFHYYQFLPHIASFYSGLKPGKFRMAA